MKKYLFFLALILIIPLVISDAPSINFLSRGQGDDLYCLLDGTNGLCGNAAGTFINLNDTPHTYVGQAGLCLAANSTEDGLEFVSCGSGGGNDTDTLWLINVTVFNNNSGTLNLNITFLTNFFQIFNDSPSILWESIGGVTKLKTPENVNMQLKNLNNLSNASFGNVTMGLLPVNDKVDSTVFGIQMIGPTGQLLPHFTLSSGGPEQFSSIGRTFGIVNELPAFFNNTNRTDCRTYFDLIGEPLMIDCNTSTTGADFFVTDDMQIVDEFWIKDTDGEYHFMTRELQIRDENTRNLTLTPIFGNLTNGNNLSIFSITGETILVNIDKSEIILNRSNESILLSEGTNTTPTFNQVYFENRDAPQLAVRGTISEEVPFVATFLLGKDFDYGSIIGGGTGGDIFRKIILRAFDDGVIYKSGFDTSASSSEINISTGTFKLVLNNIDISTTHSTFNTTIEVHNDGGFHQHINNLSGFDTYGTGELVSTNKYFNLVCGIVPTHDLEGRMYCVTQNKPSNEHTSAIEAEVDNTFINFFPNDVFIKKIFLPVARIVIQNSPSGNEIQELSSGGFFLDLRGTVSSSGSSPPTPSIVNHNELNNLEWNVSGHEGTTDLNITPFNIIANCIVINESTICDWSEVNVSSDLWDDLDTPDDINLDDLGDVDTLLVQTGDFLQKSAGDWVDFDLFNTQNIWPVNQTFEQIIVGTGFFSTAYSILFHGIDGNGTITWDNNGDEFEIDKNWNMKNNKVLFGADDTYVQGGDTAQRDLFLSAGQDIDFLIGPETVGVIDDTGLVIGSGAAGVDYTHTFNGEDNDGVITWKEDEARYEFDNTIVVSGNINATNNSHVQGTHTVEGTSTFLDEVFLGAKLTHLGDTDTYIEFTPNSIDIVAGAHTYVSHSSPAFSPVFQVNPDGADADYQVFSASDDDALVIDASISEISTGAGSTFNIKGEAKGQSHCLVYNDATARTATANQRWGNVPASGSGGDGLVMPKAGSIIDHTIAVNIQANVSGNVTFEVEIDNTVVLPLDIGFLVGGGTGVKTGFTSIPRDTTGATFTAGQVLSARANENGDMGWDDSMGLICVQFDT